MSTGRQSFALLYDDSAYVEISRRPPEAGADAPVGLVGRQVAGREFLDAYLSHGDRDDLAGVVYNQASADSLTQFCRQHPSAHTRPRRLRLVPMDQFLPTFFPRPPAPLLYTPCPPDPAFAWARHHAGPGAFALSGVTHTLCTAGAARVLCEMVTAPYEAYDSLVCTSRCVVRMVRALTGAYADYLRDRHGGTFAFRPSLETIPLGVNPDKFRPASPEERAARRAALNIRDDTVAVLFVGRFTPHAKAHPFPMFHGVARAARETGRPVHLVLSGWAPNPALLQAFLDGARSFAPGIPVSVADGMDPDLRFGVWQAADVFASFSDSIQETFGLVILEAMASGLPVVASDWDGYRDLVADGETGLLVPTAMVGGATADATARLLLGAVSYDGFLAECNQAVAVDPAAAAGAFGRLLADPALRRRLGAVGRQRVLERFTWAGVVRAYEDLWRRQEGERRAFVAAHPASGPRPPGLPVFPAPEVSFAGYPTLLLEDGARVEAVPRAEAGLGLVLALPLTNYAREQRVGEEAVLRALLDEARSPRTLAEMDAALHRLGVGHGAGRATLAWMLKYGLLRTA
jgi:glycosyltransferase involved in cell wall biosynthesis